MPSVSTFQKGLLILGFYQLMKMSYQSVGLFAPFYGNERESAIGNGNSSSYGKVNQTSMDSFFQSNQLLQAASTFIAPFRAAASAVYYTATVVGIFTPLASLIDSYPKDMQDLKEKVQLVAVYTLLACVWRATCNDKKKDLSYCISRT
jgi:hypothetical protein